MASSSHSQPDIHPTLGASLSGTNLQRAGDHNQRVILQAIRVGGTLTRSDLGQITGLTPPAIANITRRLLNDGLIQEIGRLQGGGRGHPAMQLSINPDGCFSIGVNIDRDHITVVVLDLLGQTRHRASLETDVVLPGTVADFFAEQAEKLIRRGAFPMDRLLGIGVAMPENLDRMTLPTRPRSQDAWRGTDVPSLFTRSLPLPVFVENDAAAAAVGELQFGHGLKDPSFFYVLINLGLGGGLVIDGQYYRGAEGRSGELGALPVSIPNATCLEEAVSLSALYAHMARQGTVITQPEDLLDLDTKGARALNDWLEQAADLLAPAVISVICLVNPEAVFFGGRLPGVLIDRLVTGINGRLARYRASVASIARVQRAATAADAPAMGAALLPFNAQLLPSRSTLRKTAMDAG